MIHTETVLPDATSRGWTLRDAVAPGIAAVKKDWPPFLMIQLMMAGLVFAYYRSAEVAQFAMKVGEWKVNGGLLFAFCAGAIAGGLIPEIAKFITRRTSKNWIADAAFNAFAYGIIAVEVDLFYQFQGSVFGTSTDIKTLAIKTAVDMGLFSPLLCMPTAVLLYEWRKLGFSFPALMKWAGSGVFALKVAQAVLPGWAFWIPILFGVYAMPMALQFPVSVLAEAAWSILFVFIATKHGEEQPGH